MRIKEEDPALVEQALNWKVWKELNFFGQLVPIAMLEALLDYT